MKRIIYFFLALCYSCTGFSQTQNPIKDDKIRVFIDCQSGNCDISYLKTNIKMIDFVNDRFVGDVHLIISTQSTGGGGDKYFLYSSGLKKYEGKNDTLNFFTEQSATNDEIREKLASNIKLILAPYVLKTSYAKYLTVSYKAPEDKISDAQKDPYNLWVYSISAGGNVNGDANYTSNFYQGRIGAGRTTEKQKIGISAYAYQSVNTFTVDNVTAKVKNGSFGLDIEGTKNLTQHWAIGYDLTGQYSNFNNLFARVNAAPKVEYSFFPYKEFNARRLIAEYSIGIQVDKYIDTTIYFKTRDVLPVQKLALTTSITQKWGNINAGVNWSNYLNDFSKNRFSVGGSVEWRIVKGLNFGLFGSFDIIHDQVSLVKGKATREEVLIRTKQLLSTYNYYGGANFRFQFGSRNNNAVNPQFNGLNYSYSY